MTAAAKPAAAHTPGRTVPYYACEHGIPGGCNWCRATVTTERDALRAEVARLREALRGIVDLNPDEHSPEGWNEWGEADCFHQAQEKARAALGGAK